MHSIFYDAAVSDDFRRGNLFQGQLYVYSPRPISIELCNLASDMAKEVSASHEPFGAQHHLPVGQFAKILTDLKPRFIHHPECKRLLPELLRELGCDLDKTYFEVPRLRTSTSAQGYLVFRPTVPAQLVDSGVRRRSGKRHGFPSPVLASARPQQFPSL